MKFISRVFTIHISHRAIGASKTPRITTPQEHKLADLREKSLQRVTQDFRVGRTYLARGPNLTFRRAEIISAEDAFSSEDVTEDSDDNRRHAPRAQRYNIKLLFVDEGHVEEGINLDLWTLPDDLAEDEFPRGSCEVVVVGLLPKGMCPQNIFCKSFCLLVELYVL